METPATVTNTLADITTECVLRIFEKKLRELFHLLWRGATSSLKAFVVNPSWRKYGERH